MENIKNKIKIVIWDLDDTLWRGTLAEGDSVEPIANRFDIVKKLNRRGIINSICSKNNYDDAKKVLVKYGYWDEFVFAKINFNSKGQQIQKMLKEMSLRAENTLFIDDNDANLQEVIYYNPEISVLNASQCDNILSENHLKGKNDEALTRLMSYKLLEEKTSHRDEYSTNYEFLKQSNIAIELIDYTESLFDRTYELVDRTNQLNFTKNRMSKEALHVFLDKPRVVTKLIHVVDNFGDYGLVGFYSLLDNKVVHFTFSCRIINMGVEQFVYEYLNYPEIDIVGKTATRLSRDGKKIDYIKIISDTDNIYLGDSVSNVLTEESKVKIFALGACDLFRVMGFFDMPNHEFLYECNTFVGNERGVNVGTEYIRSQLDMTAGEKSYCQNYFCNYQRENVFDSQIFAKRWDYVIMSFHDDMVFKIYNHKENPNIRVLRSPAPMYGSTSICPLNVNSYVSPGNNVRECEEWFNKEFDEGKYITKERFLDNLLYIADYLPFETKIILVTGPELEYFREKYPDVPEVHNQIVTLNSVIRLLGKIRPEKFVVADINECVKSRKDVLDYVFHLTADTGYNVFRLIAKNIINTALSKKMPMLGYSSKGRKIIVLSTDKIALENAAINLMLGNNKNILLVHYNKEKKSLEVFSKDVWHKFKHKSNEFYVVVAGQNDYPELRNLLTSTGYQPLKDFTWLVKREVNIIKGKDDAPKEIISRIVDDIAINDDADMTGLSLIFKEKVKIEPKKSNYNFYRYDLLPARKYCIILKGVCSSSLRFTAGLFDFKTNNQIHFEEFYSSKKVLYSFRTGEDVGELAFLVYAGIVGATEGEKMSIDSFEVYAV